MEISRPKKVLVVGTGYLGGRIARELLRAGCEVDATTRSHDKAQKLDALGIRAILTDLASAKGFGEFDEYDDIVLCPAPDAATEAAYQNLFVLGFEKLMNYLFFHPPKGKIVFTSSVGVYEEKDGNWVTEQTETPGGTGRTRALLHAENYVGSASFPSVILRLGGIYGPQRNRIQAVQDESYSTLNPEGFVNMVFVDDAIQSVLFSTQNGIDPGIYNVVDNEPVKRKDLFNWLAQTLHKEPPHLEGEGMPGRSGNKRVSNKKIVDSGFQFQFPNFKAGYEKLLSQTPDPFQ